MCLNPNSAYDYQVGGSLPLDAPTYVTRQADFDLYNSVLTGEFCYVLNSRQMGKSSLRVQTMRRLQAEGIACAAIDMTAIGTSGITPEQWYAGVIYSVVSSLELYETFDLETWWTERGLFSYVQRFSRFIEEVLLPSTSKNIVIFVDEIDSIISLNFKVDDFFRLIRFCYNERASRTEYKRLTFALLGVATPSDLIQETNSHSTPFNIGRAIELKGFQLEEAQPLAPGLATVASNPETVLAEVLAWTGGQPFLTQKVCKLIRTSGSSIPAGREVEAVENLVRSRLIENWEARDEPEHLKTIRTRLLTDEQRAGRLLGLYQQILTPPNPPRIKDEPYIPPLARGASRSFSEEVRGGTGGGGVADDGSPEHQKLRLTGLVVKQQGCLRVFNRIYQEVFNPAWVEKELDNLRPYSEAFRSWVNSGCQDTSQLLQGQALQEALMWAEGKSLSNLDHQFLAASQKKTNEILNQIIWELVSPLSVDEVSPQLEVLLNRLRQVSGDDSLKLVTIKVGSTILVLQGSPEGFRRIRSLLGTGQLTEILGIPVRDVKYAADKAAMRAASRYWTLVRIDASGKRKVEEIAPAKAFFLESFPEFTAQSGVPGILIERQLRHWMSKGTEQYTHAHIGQGWEVTGTTTAPHRNNDEASRSFLAKVCLQCFISSQIERVCLQLEAQFGAVHGFTCSDLLRFVLDDAGSRLGRNVTTPVSNSYQSLSQEILQSFNPEQSSLATWTSRLVKHHRELNAFLLEHGVYLVSDWAILNDTKPKQLQRIFSEFHCLTSIEIEQAKLILESYHAVYRTQRLKQRQSGIKGQCLPPTTEQLQQMAQRLSSQLDKVYRPETLMAKLQDMGSRLREYRIHVRGGSPPTEPTRNTSSDRILSRNFIDDQNTTDPETEFLDCYRQQFLTCLDQAIAHVTEEQVRKLQQKDPQKAEKFVTAMQLFYCERKSMGEIAKQVNLRAQDAVAKLLKLKSFRADVQQQLLVLLCDRVIEQAKAYTDPQRLQALSQQIEEALNEQVTTLIQEAAAEASTATGVKKQTPTSLFAERLCRYLDRRPSR